MQAELLELGLFVKEGKLSESRALRERMVPWFALLIRLLLKSERELAGVSNIVEVLKEEFVKDEVDDEKEEDFDESIPDGCCICESIIC